MINYAIFDMDGTLINSMYKWNRVIMEYIDNLGVKPDEEFIKKIKTKTLLTSIDYIHETFDIKKTTDDGLNFINFNDDGRQLELDGEAYFEVKPDADRPFVVKNEFLTTRVLGTRFNFSTRATDNTAEVTLLSGKVKVSGNHGEGMITLRPDQRVILDKASRSMEIMQTYAPVSAAWHNKVIPFTNMRIDEIVKALEEYYDVRIDISPRLQNRATYTGVINCRPTVDSVLADLSYSVPFTFHRKNGCLVLVAKHP